MNRCADWKPITSISISPHFQDDRTPIVESAAAFDALVRAGKIRAVGLSNFSADAVREWFDTATSNGLVTPVALQPHYSLVHRKPYEAELAPLANELGLAVLPYRALAGGFLSGKYRITADTEGHARGAGVRPLLTPEGLHLIDTARRDRRRARCPRRHHRCRLAHAPTRSYGAIGLGDIP